MLFVFKVKNDCCDGVCITTFIRLEMSSSLKRSFSCRAVRERASSVMWTRARWSTCGRCSYQIWCYIVFTFYVWGRKRCFNVYFCTQRVPSFWRSRRVLLGVKVYKCAMNIQNLCIFSRTNTPVSPNVRLAFSPRRPSRLGWIKCVNIAQEFLKVVWSVDKLFILLSAHQANQNCQLHINRTCNSIISIVPFLFLRPAHRLYCVNNWRLLK